MAMSSFKKILQEELECIICYDIPSAPIYSCTRGHIVCCTCVKRIGQCVTCHSPIGLCGLAERLLNRHEVNIACKYTGCSLAFKSKALLNTHLVKCEFRPINCFLKNVVDCGGRACDFDKFYEHLKKAHRCTTKDPISMSTPGRFLTFFYANTLHQPGDIAVNFPVVCLKFENKIFLFHSVKSEKNLFLWLALIGGQDEAKNYRCVLKLQSEMTADIDLSWALPVLPVNGNLTLSNVKKGFAGFHVTSLMPTSAYGLDGYKHSRKMEIEIKRIQPKNDEVQGTGKNNGTNAVQVLESKEDIQSLKNRVEQLEQKINRLMELIE